MGTSLRFDVVQPENFLLGIYGVTSGLLGTMSPNSRTPLYIGERNRPRALNCFTKYREGETNEWKVVCLNICLVHGICLFLPVPLEVA